MKKVKMGKTGLEVPAVVVGCMRFSNLTQAEVTDFVAHGLEIGTNFFDHADIYGEGTCEEKFGRALKENNIVREDVIIQSKCGIIPGVMYDSSKEHIIESVDKSLKRLGIEYLDTLLLHRPDALVEPEEVAQAFDQLEEQGKVRNFGVSNHNMGQITLLQKYVRQPIAVNQLQFGVAHSNMIARGIEVNMLTEGSLDRDGGILDFCRREDITIQAWSPFQYGFFDGVYLDNDKYPKLNEVIGQIADKYGVTKTTIGAAWILRHPAQMQIIAGTMKKSRLEEICEATKINMTKKEWYEIYQAAGRILP